MAKLKKELFKASVRKKIMLYLSPSFIITVLALYIVFSQYQSLIFYQQELENLNNTEKHVYHIGWKIFELSLYESKYIDISPDTQTKALMGEMFRTVKTGLNEVNESIKDSPYNDLDDENLQKMLRDFGKTSNLLQIKSEETQEAVIERTLKGNNITPFVIKESVNSKNNMVSIMINKGLSITGIYKDIVNKKISSLTSGIYYLILAAGALVALISFIASHLIGKTLQKNISDINVELDKVSSGNLNIHFNQITSDEIGSIKNQLLLVSKGLRNLISNIIDNKNKVDAFSNQLLQRSNQSKEHALNIENHMTKVTNNISDQYQAITEISSTTQELSASMEQIAASIDSVSSNANTVNSLSSKGFEETQNIEVQMNEIVEQTNHLNVFSNQLVENIKKITSISSKINQIADQTKILSLNATIEAARAGLYGKGFAVVANEVGELASQSSALSDEITKLLSETEDVTNNTVSSLNNSIIVVKEGKEKVNQASSTFKEIASNIDILTNQINEIVAGIKQINRATESSVEYINNMATSSETLSTVSKDVLDNVMEQSNIAKSLNDDVEDLKKITYELNESVGRFKI